jgi:hypothetical protein
MREYELTDEEVRDIMHALRYASENAIHPDAKATFSTTLHTIETQRKE